MKYHNNEAIPQMETFENEEILKAVQAKQLKEKQQSGMMLQIICQKSGIRSEPFMANFSELAKILNNEMEKDESNITPDDFILLVAVMNGEDTKIPTTSSLSSSITGNRE